MSVGEEVGEGPPQVPDTCPGPAKKCYSLASVPHSTQLSGLPDPILGPACPLL